MLVIPSDNHWACTSSVIGKCHFLHFAVLAVLSQQLAVAKSEQAYMCNAEERLGLAVDTNHTLNITMMLKDLKVQAFSFSKNNTFDSGEFSVLSYLYSEASLKWSVTL